MRPPWIARPGRAVAVIRRKVQRRGCGDSHGLSHQRAQDCRRRSYRASEARSEAPPEPREMRGHGGERPCLLQARAPRAIPRWRRTVGDGKGQGGRSGRTAAESERRCARWEGKWSGRFARRRERGEGVSRSRTRRGASGARRGRGDFARSAKHASGRAKTPPHPENALAAGRRMSRALARRAARRDARRGSCVRSGGGQGERSEGAGLRLRQCLAGRRPARYCGAEPHRRAETGKAGLATWTAAGKRRMSVVRNPSRVAPDVRGRMRGACCGLEVETPIRGTPTR